MQYSVNENGGVVDPTVDADVLRGHVCFCSHVFVLSSASVAAGPHASEAHPQVGVSDAPSGAFSLSPFLSPFLTLESRWEMFLYFY